MVQQTYSSSNFFDGVPSVRKCFSHITLTVRAVAMGEDNLLKRPIAHHRIDTGVQPCNVAVCLHARCAVNWQLRREKAAFCGFEPDAGKPRWALLIATVTSIEAIRGDQRLGRYVKEENLFGIMVEKERERA